MLEQQQQQNPAQERIERDVRMLLGDLQMQIIVLRSMLEQAQQQVQASKPNGDGRAEARL